MLRRKAYPLFTDRVYRLPRLWSNEELRKFSGLFTGSVINVSAWRDEDKEGGKYKNYFSSASSYRVSNYVAEKRGYQGEEGEIFLDLEKGLSSELKGRFDVVFNHTTLEHIYNYKKALRNICALSRDVVIVVVPFLQPMHDEYGDYWRFSPSAVKKCLMNWAWMFCF